MRFYCRTTGKIEVSLGVCILPLSIALFGFKWKSPGVAERDNYGEIVARC